MVNILRSNLQNARTANEIARILIKEATTLEALLTQKDHNEKAIKQINQFYLTTHTFWKNYHLESNRINNALKAEIERALVYLQLAIKSLNDAKYTDAQNQLQGFIGRLTTYE